MEKHKFFTFLCLIIFIGLFGIAASCNFCGVPIDTGETEVTAGKTTEKEVLEDKETKEQQAEKNQQESSQQTQTTGEKPEIETIEREYGDIGEIVSETPISQAILHPSDIGYIIQHVNSQNLVDTTILIIGDSITNDDIRGFFSFDVSGLSGKEIISASLVLNTHIIHGEPSFKDYIGLRWGTYLPLDPDDYLMLGTHPVTSFDNHEEPIRFSREDLVVAIDNMANVTIGKLEFAIGYSNGSSNGDAILDGREYRTEDITLSVEYGG